MLDQVMLDLETLDNIETAVILSIGAVRFDLTTGELGDQFYCTVDPIDCQRHGLTIGASTVSWWMQQSREAQAAIFTTDSRSLPKALQDFTRYIEEVKHTSVWGNGSTFDNMIIRNTADAIFLFPGHFAMISVFAQCSVCFLERESLTKASNITLSTMLADKRNLLFRLSKESSDERIICFLQLRP